MMNTMSKQFFGKYRGKVVRNADPQKLGRLQVSVPSVLGNTHVWAMPAVPYAGPRVGWVVLPPQDANIWVEFEGGDIHYPVWTGCFWGANELPTEADKPEIKLLKLSNLTLQLDETAGKSSVLLKIDSPAVQLKLAGSGIELQIGETSIKLTNTDIKMASSGQSIQLSAGQVSINNGALEIT